MSQDDNLTCVYPHASGFLKQYASFQAWQKSMGGRDKSSEANRSFHHVYRSPEAIFQLDSSIRVKRWISTQHDAQYFDFHPLFLDVERVLTAKSATLKRLLCDRKQCRHAQSSAVQPMCVFARDRCHRIAFHHAIQHEHWKLIKYLLRRKDARIQLLVRDLRGRTPIHCLLYRLSSLHKRLKKIGERESSYKRLAYLADRTILMLRDSAALYSVRDCVSGHSIAKLDCVVRGDFWDCYRSGDVARLDFICRVYDTARFEPDEALYFDAEHELSILWRTPLHEACEQMQCGMLSYLLERTRFGAWYWRYAVDRSGCTALHYAAMRGSLRLCQILMDMEGSSVMGTVLNGSRLTALHCSLAPHLSPERIQCAKFLAYHASDALHLMDNDGHTPLHYAIWKGNLELVRYFIALGANVNACLMAQSGEYRVRKYRTPCSRVIIADSSIEQYECTRRPRHLHVVTPIASKKSRCKEKICKNDRCVRSASPLSFAIRCGFCCRKQNGDWIAIVEALLSVGALLNGSSFEETKYTPLSEAFRSVQCAVKEMFEVKDALCVQVFRLLWTYGAKRLCARTLSSLLLTVGIRAESNVQDNEEDGLVPKCLLLPLVGYVVPLMHMHYHPLLFQLFMHRAFRVLRMIQETFEGQSAKDSRARTACSIWSILYVQAQSIFCDEKKRKKSQPLLSLGHLLFLQRQIKISATASPLTELLLFLKKKWLLRGAETGPGQCVGPYRLHTVLADIRELLAFEEAAGDLFHLRWNTSELEALVGILVSLDAMYWHKTRSNGAITILWELIVERVVHALSMHNIFLLDLVLKECPKIVCSERPDHIERWLCTIEAARQTCANGNDSNEWMLSFDSILYSCAYNLPYCLVERILNLFVEVQSATHETKNGQASVMLTALCKQHRLYGTSTLQYIALYNRWDIWLLFLPHISREALHADTSICILRFLARMSTGQNAEEWKQRFCDVGDEFSLLVHSMLPQFLASNTECIASALRHIIALDAVVVLEYCWAHLWNGKWAKFENVFPFFPLQTLLLIIVQYNATNVLESIFRHVEMEPSSQRSIVQSLMQDQDVHLLDVARALGNIEIAEAISEFCSIKAATNPVIAAQHGLFAACLKQNASRNAEIGPSVLTVLCRKQQAFVAKHINSFSGDVQIACACNLVTHVEVYATRGLLHASSRDFIQMLLLCIEFGSLDTLQFAIKHYSSISLPLCQIEPSDANHIWKAVLRHSSNVFGRMTELLLRNKLTLPRLRGDGIEYTLLHRVTTYADESLFARIKLLLERANGAIDMDWNVLDAEGNTPITYAMAHGRFSNVCSLLLQRSVRLEAEFEGQTAFYYLTYALANDSCRFLVEQLLIRERGHAYLHCLIEDCSCKGYESSNETIRLCDACSHDQSTHTRLPPPPWQDDQNETYGEDNAWEYAKEIAQCIITRNADIFSAHVFDISAFPASQKARTIAISHEYQPHALPRKILHRQRAILPMRLNWKVKELKVAHEHSQLKDPECSIGSELFLTHPSQCLCQQMALCLTEDMYKYYCLSHWLKLSFYAQHTQRMIRSAFMNWRKKLDLEAHSEIIWSGKNLLRDCIWKWKHYDIRKGYKKWKCGSMGMYVMQKHVFSVAEEMAAQMRHFRYLQLQFRQHEISKLQI